MILILDNASPLFLKMMSIDGVVVSHQYKALNLVGRVLRKVFVDIFNFSSPFFYNVLFRNLDIYSTVIIYAYRNNIDVIRYICSKRSSNQRIIVWYWNPIFRCIHPDAIRNLDCELWSFDPIDCLRYNLNFNTTYYFRGLKLPSSSLKHVNVFFCGLDKGRKKVLDDICMKLERATLTYDFHVINEKAPVSQQLPRLSYQEYLEHLASSDAVLDVLQEGQEGMTLRVMEALFHQKKLITTQKAIMKAEFYHPDNVFVIGEDNWAGIKNFLEQPLHPVPKEVVEKYDFPMWIRRFGIDLENK